MRRRRRCRSPGRARDGARLGAHDLPVGVVAPAKAVEPPAPLLEEGDHRVQIVERLDAVAGVVAAARVRPAAVALLEARAEHDDIGAPLRPALRAARDVGRKADLVEAHDTPRSGRGNRQQAVGSDGTAADCRLPHCRYCLTRFRCPSATARASIAATCASERRKLSASGVVTLKVTLTPPPPPARQRRAARRARAPAA